MLRETEGWLKFCETGCQGMLELCGHSERIICSSNMELWRRELEEINQVRILQVKKAQPVQLPTEDRDDSAGLSRQREELFFLPQFVCLFSSL